MNIPSILWNTIDPLVLGADTPASYAAVEGAIAKLDCAALKSLIMEGTLASAAFWTARGLTAMSIGIWDDFSEDRLNEMADELLSFGSQTVLTMLVRPEVMTELILDTNKLTKPRPVHMALALYKTRCGQHFDFEKACALLPVHVPGYWDLTYKDAVGAYILKKYGQEIAPGLWKKHDMDRRIKQIIFMEDAPKKSPRAAGPKDAPQK